MAAFNKLRYPKVSLVLCILSFLAVLALIVRMMTGTYIRQAGFLPIFIIGLAFNLIAVILWLLLRKKGVKFIDLYYPVTTACAIVIFIYFNIVMFV